MVYRNNKFYQRGQASEYVVGYGFKQKTASPFKMEEFRVRNYVKSTRKTKFRLARPYYSIESNLADVIVEVYCIFLFLTLITISM